MKKLAMVDLIGQYNKIKPEIDKAIMDVIASSAYINGPEVKSLAAELQTYLNIKHVMPCANGTDALQIVMMALGLQPGDEVITASFTYVATAEVIALLRLTPVLVEVNPETFTIDPDAIEKAITPNTKAIVAVHLYGQCAEMERIMEIAKKHNLYVIEDNAQAIGSDYYFKDGSTKKAGTIGTAGTTSFFPSKNLGCYGDGGAIFCDDDVLSDKIRMMANHGQGKLYYHDEVGCNSRLDSIQAAVLRIKLKHLDEYAAARNRVADYYDKAFAGNPKIKTPARASWSNHVFHQYTLKLYDVNRDDLRAFLTEKGIPSMIYYPVAVHQQKAYRSNRYPDGAFPVTEDLITRVISLPMQTELDDEQLKFITDGVLEFVK